MSGTARLLTLSGTVNNKGTLYAGQGLLDIAGVVVGGVSEIADGVVEIQKASSENVSFLSYGTGGLQLDNASAYTGKISGFGGSAHSNHKQFIDLSAVPYSAGVVSESYSGNATSGVLTVTSVPWT